MSLDRRAFLRGSAAGGAALVLGLRLDAAGAAEIVPQSTTPVVFSPNPFISISEQGIVSLVSKKPEIGQGIKTSLPMVIAEELEVEWKDVRIIQGDLDPAYGNQTAGGSRSTPENYENFLLLGATARTLLIQAAAQSWKVPVQQCHAARGAVHHAASRRSLRYGALVERAAALPVPAASAVKLKDPADYRLIGTRKAGVDNQSIVTGKPIFGIDMRLPGMLFAVYEKCPVFGGKVVEANLAAVKKLPGVRDAFVIEGTSNLTGLLSGVAIVASSTWAAMKARKALRVTWDEGQTATESWAGYADRARALAREAGVTRLRSDGDVAAGLASAARTVEAEYSYPFVSHSPLEPQNCTAWFRGGTMEIWAPTQNPASGLNLVANTLGLPRDRITVHITRSGGGFGRRLGSDFMVEAAAIAQKVGKPVKLQWSREDDLRHDQYRAGGFHFIRGGVDANGRLSAWHDHFVTFANRVMREGKPALQGASGASLSADEFPARTVANCLLEQTAMDCGIPMGPWRAPGSNVFAWVTQSFIDELAHAAGRDPLQFRLELLGEPAGVAAGNPNFDAPRMRRVLQEVADKSGWGGPALPRGQGRGIAFHFSHRGYVAEVAEVSVSTAGALKVDRVVVVADVGSQIVNPSGAENQVQGSVIDGLGTLMHAGMDIQQGRVAQSNFGDYPLIRMNEAPPRVEVHFIKSANPVTGLGEPALPPLAPAVCNAIFAATGKRVRTWPLAKVDLSWA